MVCSIPLRGSLGCVRILFYKAKVKAKNRKTFVSLLLLQDPQVTTFKVLKL